ncbi:MAG: hypothetical protein WBV22_06615 [Anaerolineaceae bacterium]
MNITTLEQEYARTIITLTRTGLLANLPRSQKSGVVGFDGKEYPVPTREQLRQLFTRNKELVDRKSRQGFTLLQLTPIAMPVSGFMDRVKTVIIDHAAAGKILRTKMNATEDDIPVDVNTRAPVWIWERVRQVLDTPAVVYFPQVYIGQNHQGFTKEEVMQNTRFCAVPGWSVGLIEPMPVMPQPGQGKVVGGRKRLETYFTPRDYLQTLNTSAYQGETGWTLEDFLTYFITRLETTHQVSHDRYDSNALWLLGMYLPDLKKTPNIVPVGYWSRDVGRKLYLSAHRTGNHFQILGARSMVRLGS